MFKLAVIFSVILIIGIAAPLTDEEQWEEFKIRSGKNYATKYEEDARFKVFQDNLKIIKEHNEKYNRGESTYMLGITDFTDLTNEEFQKYHTGGSTAFEGPLGRIPGPDPEGTTRRRPVARS